MRRNNLIDMVERFRRYGEDGRELEASQLAAEEAATQAIIERAEVLASLSEHPGWKIVKAAMEENVAKYTDSLINSYDERDMIRKQEYVKARSQLLNWISNSIQEGKSYLEEIKKQASDSSETT